MQFIDLERQYNTIKEDVDYRIRKVLEHQKYIMGPEVEEMERELAAYTGRKHVFSCASGTDALTIPLMALDLKETDAVFVPSFTFFASGECVALVGATPVFVDCDETYNIDTVKLRKTIQEVLDKGELQPKGIIPVDLFGLSANYNEILAIAKEYNLFVLEDAAQGFGAEYNGKRTGSFGDISATSFFPAKPLGCYGDGGAIFTDDDDLAEKIHSIRVHGQGTSRYDNVRIGLNGRMDTIQAAVVLSKLKVFDEEIRKRQLVAKKYCEELEGYYRLPVIPNDCLSSWAQFTLQARDEEHRDYVINKLKEYNIPIMVYYILPLHMQTAFKYLEYSENDLPVCADFCKKVFSVPMHPYLKQDEIIYICNKLKECK
nr:DegT/DnrJ/EryC1/StrS family aminotransferase [Massilistercora timonensis]